MPADMSSDTVAAESRATGMAGPWSAFLHRCCAHLEAGEVSVTFPNGCSRSYRGKVPGPRVVLIFRTWTALRRIAFGGELGFAEAYLAGEIDVDDVDGLLRLGGPK